MSQHEAIDREDIPDVHNPKYHHGRSPAAWAGVIVAMVGFVVMGVAILADFNLVVFWISVGLLVASVIATRALQVLGFGNNHHLNTETL